MPAKTEEKVSAFLEQNSLLLPGTKVLLAVSGGADSVALVEILTRMKRTGRINNDFHIAHINHQLRGDKALEDEKFVKALAKKHKLPLTIKRIDVKKYAQKNRLSIETAARILRLEKLADIAKENGCDRVAAAHHKNDNAETIIHRIVRGTAFKGLAGIRPKITLNLSAGALAKADGIIFIRPLLCLSRGEIEDYLVSQEICWQTDHTNLDCRFTRNRIRHRLLPLLQSQSRDDLTELLFILSQKCLTFSQEIERQAKTALQDCTINQSQHLVSMDTEKFNDYSPLLRVEIIQDALQQLGIGLQKITAEHYNKTINFLTDSRTGKTMQLPNNTVIKKEQNSFSLGHPQICTQKPKPVELKIPGSVCFGEWVIETQILPAARIDIENLKKSKNSFIEWFDLKQIKPPLFARYRQKGDKFKPFGLGASKKVGKFITSAKIGSDQRKTAFILCDSEKILWLVPIRRSGEAVITSKNQSLLQIKTSKNRPKDV